MIERVNIVVVLENLVNTPPPTEPLMHVYADRVVFNRHAVSLLDLKEGSYVSFKKGGQHPGVGAWVGKVDCASYKVSMRNKTARVGCRSLADKLAETLEGQGTYRIERENRVQDVSGYKFYSVFYRKYDKL